MIRYLVVALASGLSFGLLWGWLTGFGIVPGLFAGALFGCCVASVEVVMRKRLLTSPMEADGELVVFRSLANHFRGGEAVGGRLILTESRLIFEPHAINLQTGRWEVPLSDILLVEPRRTAWAIPNGLHVSTKAGAERFVVAQRAHWLRQLNGGPGI